MEQEIFRPVFLGETSTWMTVDAPTIKDASSRIKLIQNLLDSHAPRTDAFITINDENYPGFCFDTNNQQIIVTDGFTLIIEENGDREIVPHTIFVRR